MRVNAQKKRVDELIAPRITAKNNVWKSLMIIFEKEEHY